jgi:iron(III) transport system permease protein
VTLPQLRPAIAAGAILVAPTLSEFGAVSMLRYDTLTPLAYIQYTTSFDRSAAVLGCRCSPWRWRSRTHER